MSYIPEPVTRTDKYLAYIAGNMGVTLPDHPITRKEHYLAAWAKKSGFEDVDVAGEPPLTLENAIGKPLKGLRIYGKSKQVTTTGAQLLEKNIVVHPPNGEVGSIVLFEGELSGTYTVSCALEGDVKKPDAAALGIIVDGVYKYCLANNHTVATGIITKITCFAQNTYCDFTGTLNIMLNAGSTPLPWEPYTGGKPSPSPDYPQEIESVGQGGIIGVEVRGENPNSAYKPQSMDIATPNGLPGIPVSSGDNYMDTDGQQWICDEIDFGRGVYAQNIKVSKSLNDLSWHTWGVNKGANGITGFYTYNIDIPKIGEAVSNIALYNEDIHGGKMAGICASTIKPTSMTPYMILCVHNDTLSDVSSDNAAIQSFKEMLTKTDAYMMYVLATPIETPLTSDQLAAYKQLHTYKGPTIIDNDAGAYMSVRYEKMK